MHCSGTISVLICTYRRPNDLLRCLSALEQQTLPPAEVIVTVRDNDAETFAALSSRDNSRLPLRILVIFKAGVIAARNAALDVCKSDFMVMADDDTAAHPDWLERIYALFAANPSVGGIGGRDRCLLNGEWDDRQQARVGEIQWFGRLIGNNHLGFGAPRTAHILKGANMSFRMSAVGDLRVDERLRGSGAQPHEDSVFCASLRKKGYDILYDPSILVDHYEGQRDEPRHYSDVLRVKVAEELRDLGFNWAIVMSIEFPFWQQAIFIAWNFLIGTRIAPGLVQAVRFTPSLGVHAWWRFWLIQQGTFRCYAYLFRTRKQQPERNSSETRLCQAEDSTQH
jgi:GT2 family glycosyltransferase